MRSRIRRNLVCSFLAGTFLAGAGQAMGEDELEPYKMVRSLQFVQDSIVQGDHSAGEMQRFLLKTLDQRLRNAPPETFRDPRNVDAVVIMAMSGGNPQTLDFLSARDVSGEFDNRLTRTLRRYLQGQGVTTLPTLDPLVKEYSSSEVGPYLALVAGNIAVAVDPKKSLDYFDQVRLLAPGTNLEEAALRRSLVIALQLADYHRAFDLAGKYVRRFIYSPYASQFADVFVQMVVDGDEKIGREEWRDMVGAMDAERAKELYLRIARRAVVVGKDELAREAADAAEAIGKPVAEAAPGPEEGPAADKTIGQLYSNLANVSSANVLDVARSLAEIPDEALSARDRNLRDAARDIAQQILMPPQPASGAMPASEPPHNAPPAAVAPVKIDAAGSTAAGPAENKQVAEDGGIRSYVDQNRMKLQQIDDLLKEEVK